MGFQSCGTLVVDMAEFWDWLRTNNRLPNNAEEILFGKPRIDKDEIRINFAAAAGEGAAAFVEGSEAFREWEPDDEIPVG